MDQIQKAVEILKQGGIVIYPTDTAFGVGCRLDNQEAIKRLFRIRQRPKDKAIPVLVDSFKMAKKYWSSPLPDIVRRISKKYWPGGLTIVFNVKNNAVSPLATGAKPTIGLRMPNHQVPLKLIKELGVPILGPSANVSGGKTPYKFEDLDKDFIKKVDYIIEAESKGNIASTVLDCSVNPPVVIRHGAVKIDMIANILHIDTSSNQTTIVSLQRGTKKSKKEKKLNHASQNLLPLIEEILQENKLNPKDIDEIKINTGPGSFTGLRVGVAIANTIGTEMKIPINNNPVGIIVEPSY